MRMDELKGKRIAIWGTGREGRAAVPFIRASVPGAQLVFLDEAAGDDTVDGINVARGQAAIAAAIEAADVIVKSPGITLYHPLIGHAKGKGTKVTSLINLWFAQGKAAKTVCVTGTKGKSTTSSLILHALKKLGARAAIAGNIGIPVSEQDTDAQDVLVVEMSSYHAADFAGQCDVAVVTSLYPEHLDWHGNVDAYFRDKLQLLAHATTRIAAYQAVMAANEMGINLPRGTIVVKAGAYETLRNEYLKRPHNLGNVACALEALVSLGHARDAALEAMEGFAPLPHRQQELGVRDGILYVNDSISTTPQSTVAALQVYGKKPVVLIAGGFDRGISYDHLVEYLAKNAPLALICLGPSGERIYDGVAKTRPDIVFKAQSMEEAVSHAKAHAPEGGVILLSPAAPSYGMFKDFTERGAAFARISGFAS